MALNQSVATSFKQEMLQGIHNLTSDVLKIALYTANASLSYATTAYTTVGEASGAGYTTGGIVLSNVTVQASGGVVYVSFANPSWAAALTARGALIYNASKANRAIAILNFGSDKSSTSLFTVNMPPNTPSTALLLF